MRNTQHEFIQGFAITILTVAMSVTFLFFLFGCFEDTSDHVGGTTGTTSSSSSESSSAESTSTTGIDPSTSTGSTSSSTTSSSTDTGSESTEESSTGEPEHTCCDMTIFPGCGDAMIEACVCAVSQYCCESTWDGVCVQTAQDLGCLVCP